jgi:hypothetical protein
MTRATWDAHRPHQAHAARSRPVWCGCRVGSRALHRGELKDLSSCRSIHAEYAMLDKVCLCSVRRGGPWSPRSATHLLLLVRVASGAHGHPCMLQAYARVRTMRHRVLVYGQPQAVLAGSPRPFTTPPVPPPHMMPRHDGHSRRHPGRLRCGAPCRRAGRAH